MGLVLKEAHGPPRSRQASPLTSSRSTAPNALPHDPQLDGLPTSALQKLSKSSFVRFPQPLQHQAIIGVPYRAALKNKPAYSFLTRV